MNVNKVLFQFIKIAFSIMLLLLIVYGLVTVGKTAYDFGYRVFTESPMEEAPGTDVLVQVKDGMSEKELGTVLEEKRLVRDAALFYWQLKLSAYDKKIRSGVYTLNTSMTAKEMMAIMAAEPEEDTQSEESAETQSVIEETTQEDQPEESEETGE